MTKANGKQRLVLSRQTLRNLVTSDLAHVQGGYPSAGPVVSRDCAAPPTTPARAAPDQTSFNCAG